MDKKPDSKYTRMLREDIKQFLEDSPNKLTAVQPPATHHENYPNETNQARGTLLEK